MFLGAIIGSNDGGVKKLIRWLVVGGEVLEEGCDFGVEGLGEYGVDGLVE